MTHVDASLVTSSHCALLAKWPKVHRLPKFHRWSSPVSEHTVRFVSRNPRGSLSSIRRPSRCSRLLKILLCAFFSRTPLEAGGMIPSRGRHRTPTPGELNETRSSKLSNERSMSDVTRCPLHHLTAGEHLGSQIQHVTHNNKFLESRVGKCKTLTQQPLPIQTCLPQPLDRPSLPPITSTSFDSVSSPHPETSLEIWLPISFDSVSPDDPENRGSQRGRLHLRRPSSGLTKPKDSNSVPRQGLQLLHHQNLPSATPWHMNK